MGKETCGALKKPKTISPVSLFRRKMHQIVTLVAIILFSIFLQSSPSWSLVISNEQGVKELLQNNAEPTVNNNINTITSDKTLVEEESKYSCFPWIFNPGCPLNRLVNWNWVCRTNTLGWEQCDVFEDRKGKRHHLEFPGDDQMPKKY